MRLEECEYWDSEVVRRFGTDYLHDNLPKRAAIANHIFALDWLDKRILEIGVGLGSIAAALRAIYLGKIRYTGTEVSPAFCRVAKEVFNLDLVNTDILNLPKTEGGYERVIALDSLEHVHPADRLQGYRNIGKVMAPDATMVINLPLNKSGHNEKFDWGFGLSDIDLLCREADLTIENYEKYWVAVRTSTNTKQRYLFYGWVVLKRGQG